MAAQIPLPPPLKVDGDLSGSWRKFRQLWDSYEVVTGLQSKDDKIRSATFVTAIGIDALDIHNNLPFACEADTQKMSCILDLWDNHCQGATNVIYERYRFNNCTQGNDTFDVFLMKLRALAKSCDYGTLTDDLRGRIW